MILKKVLFAIFTLLFGISALAQNKVTAILKDAQTGESVSFATASLTKTGTDKPTAYTLSDKDGKLSLTNVKNGEYSFAVEMMGYKPYSKKLTLKGTPVDLGTVKLEIDSKTLAAASVSAVGNNMVVKKDTIEINAGAFKTTENDALEDLLKKIPGMEIAEDGSITYNGDAIDRITINGKTFFLDDPQLASKNLPAKLIEKVKVLEKKSEQAEFTGIDDGESTTVLDLSIKKGMMNGLFGNVSGGGGVDLPTDLSAGYDPRWQGAGMIGNFTEDQQLTALFNVNNTNNRGFNDVAGSMMQGMRQGGMGLGQGGWGRNNGITTSYMGGLNGAWNLFDDRMELGGNYMFTGTQKLVEEQSDKTTYLSDQNLLYNTNGVSTTDSWGHNIGVRLNHKFSDNTSIFFEPRVNFGSGAYTEKDSTSTTQDIQGAKKQLSSAYTANDGVNKNLSTSGFLLLRQRLGIPGRTLTAMFRGSYSQNNLEGHNLNRTTSEDEQNPVDSTVHQLFNTDNRSYGLMGRLTYTEPLGGHFYIEANYAYDWAKSTSVKETQDLITGQRAEEYSNNIENQSNKQEIGANMLYQTEKIRLQAGFAAMPTKTENTTTKGTTTRVYDDFRWNFSPTAMVFWDVNDNSNLRAFYRGTTNQPSTSQLMPVPDNTNPLNITFGNPTLVPYFTHSLRGDYRFNDKANFSSVNVRFNGGAVQDPVVNMVWYNPTTGGQYSIPLNGPTSGNFRVNTSFNIPIAKSGFYVANVLNVRWSNYSSYVGSDIDMSIYEKQGYYAFVDWFSQQIQDPEYRNKHISTNVTNTLGITERLKFTYRNDNLEVYLQGQTRPNQSWYSISQTQDQTLTWNNQVKASVNWTWQATGLVLATDFNYNWYRGYTTDQPDEYVWDAEIQKLLFKKKFTLALKCYDILGQAKNISVSDASNYHQESRNNTLGRYIILSLTYRFGKYNKQSGNSGPGGMGGPMMGPPPGRM